MQAIISVHATRLVQMSAIRNDVKMTGYNENLARPPRHSSQQNVRDFDNPFREWRRLFAETWGTFLLVLVAAGGHVVGAISGG